MYFGYIGEDEATKLKIALIKCYGGRAVPGGPTVVVLNVVSAFRPKAVISVGYCASLNHQNAKLGDVVVSANLTTYALQKSKRMVILRSLVTVCPQKSIL